MSEVSPNQGKVTWVGYLAFFLTIIFFSGFFAKATEWWRVFDFTVLNGTFGQVNGEGAANVSFAAQAVPAQKMAFCLRWNLHRLLFCRWASFQ